MPYGYANACLGPNPGARTQARSFFPVRLSVLKSRAGIKKTPPLLLLAAVAFLSAFIPRPAGGQTPAERPPLTQSDDLQDPQPAPVFTGSAGFLSTFDGGEPHLGPIATSVLLVPISQRWLVETRATFESDLTQVPGQPGFHGVLQKEVDYAQVDFIANPYLIVTVGRFLTPFGIFNERLYPVWIRNLQSDPLILPIGIGPSNASSGGMLRGGFAAPRHFNVNYAVYYSARSPVSPVDSDRFAGGRAGIFIPKARLEVGGSFQHRLQEERSNLFGFH